MNQITRDFSDHDAGHSDRGFIVWIVLFAVLMVGFLTLAMGTANVIGNHFDTAAVSAWNAPGG